MAANSTATCQAIADRAASRLGLKHRAVLLMYGVKPRAFTAQLLADIKPEDCEGGAPGLRKVLQARATAPKSEGGYGFVITVAVLLVAAITALVECIVESIYHHFFNATPPTTDLGAQVLVNLVPTLNELGRAG